MTLKFRIKCPGGNGLSLRKDDTKIKFLSRRMKNPIYLLVLTDDEIKEEKDALLNVLQQRLGMFSWINSLQLKLKEFLVSECKFIKSKIN